MLCFKPEFLTRILYNPFRVCYTRPRTKESRVSIKEKQKHNLKDFFENGPSLQNKQSYILAKDSQKGFVFLGGLGAVGVGRMWTATTEKHKSHPEYAQAKETEFTGERVPFLKNILNEAEALLEANKIKEKADKT